MKRLVCLLFVLGSSLLFAQDLVVNDTTGVDEVETPLEEEDIGN